MTCLKWHRGGLLATRDYLEKFLLSSKHLSQTYSQPLNSAFGSSYPVSSSSSNQTPAPQRSKPPSLQASSTQPKSNDASFTPHTSYSRPGGDEQFQERINLLEKMVANDDAQGLASIHDRKPDGCFLHLNFNNHRLCECHRFRKIIKDKPELMKSIINLATIPIGKTSKAKRVVSDYAEKTYSSKDAVALASQLETSFLKIENVEPYSASLPLRTSSPRSFCLTHVRAISDTGATDHMSEVMDLFSTLFTYPIGLAPEVTLGDDSRVMASGWGLIDYIEGEHRIRRVALFVPQLGNNTLISISRHIQYDGCMFHAENNSAVLAYPSHTTDLAMCPEMHSSVVPSITFGSLPDDVRVPSFDESMASFASRADFATSLVPTSVLDFIDASDATSFVRTALFHPLISDAVLPSCSSKSHLHINLPKPILLLPKKVSIVPLGFRITLPSELEASFLSFLHPSISVKMTESSGGVVLHINNNSSTQCSVTSLGEIIISDHKGPLSAITIVQKSSPKAARASGYHTRKRGFFHLDDSNFIYYSHQRQRTRAKRVTIPRPDLLPTRDDTPNDHKDPATVPTHLYRPVQSPSPKPRPWDRVPSSTPAKVSFTPDRLLKCIGFLSSSKMQKALCNTSLNSINILDIDKIPTLDPGETASLKAAARNRSKLPLPDNVGDVWHIDIGFGPSRAVGGVFYALMAVDRKSRYNLSFGKPSRRRHNTN